MTWEAVMKAKEHAGYELLKEWLQALADNGNAPPGLRFGAEDVLIQAEAALMLQKKRVKHDVR